jgi:hypothetical protein
MASESVGAAAADGYGVVIEGLLLLGGFKEKSLMDRETP